MRAEGVPLNPLTYTAAIAAAQTLGKPDEALALFEEMQSQAVGQLDVLVLELASLHEEVLLLDQQTRLATLIPTWTLRNLDGEELRGLIADVVGLARRYLFPVLELWYPDALARLATNGAFAARLWRLARDLPPMLLVHGSPSSAEHAAAAEVQAAVAGLIDEALADKGWNA